MLCDDHQAIAVTGVDVVLGRPIGVHGFAQRNNTLFGIHTAQLRKADFILYEFGHFSPPASLFPIVHNNMTQSMPMPSMPGMGESSADAGTRCAAGAMDTENFCVMPKSYCRCM